MNTYGFLFGGILFRYATQQGAEDDVIEDIKTFAKYFRMNDSIVMMIPGIKTFFLYSNGHQRKIGDEPDLPSLEIINDDPDFD
ncbi:hypothetical protein TVAG_248530 [Trichomonas vaginalis G3]|uniref:Uncharacterized protein n=1 Tax=Trichomonas vaginalis (strain ATCC PRA-98 / G3) TaxID=412133 RepID=A2E789_TRIV3|nr:hypothetical protein TVAGG3_0283750 [Trichomonas vaginalis G3]EAY11486.1 hypothetical protein TVAG_248530 [Trichomonas vaginalis G3]KAI5526752.1 hypothetical protein TVAGG3_0283750 [Trichomonas vaginalis G3]|eukprot:XP_001323709.1 hypothetical protein [Trichomonas vaginalis G3]